MKILHWLHSGLLKEPWEHVTVEGHTYTNSRGNIVCRYIEPALNKGMTKVYRRIRPCFHISNINFPNASLRNNKWTEFDESSCTCSPRKFQKPETAAQTCCLYFVSFYLYKYTRRFRRLFWQQLTHDPIAKLTNVKTLPPLNPWTWKRLQLIKIRTHVRTEKVSKAVWITDI